MKYCCSVTRKSLLAVAPIILNGLSWLVGNGFQIRVGFDRLLGTPSAGVLSVVTIQHLHDMGLVYLNQVKKLNCDDRLVDYWLSARDIQLTGEAAIEWDSYITGLTHAGIILNDGNDSLVWEYGGGDGTVSTDVAYHKIAENSRPLR